MNSDFFKSIPNEFNIAAYLLDINKNNHDRIAFIDKQSLLTYGSLDLSVKKAATLLSKLGLKKDQKAALLLTNRLEFVVTFLATIWLGAIAVPIHPSLSKKEVEYILEDCNPSILILEHEQNEYCENRFLTLQTHNLFSFIENETISKTPQETSKNEQAYWLYTSGTTGSPKGVMHSHQTAAHITESYAVKTICLNLNDRVFSVASLAFAYGLGCSLFFPMRVGASSVLLNHQDIFELIEFINDFKPTVFFGIPTLFHSILQLKNLFSLDFSFMRFCVTAAEPISQSLIIKWKEQFDIPILDGLGATEVGNIFISNSLEAFKCGSIGKPIPDYQALVKDDWGNILNAGEVGNLWLKSKSLMLGYWNKPEATKNVLKEDEYCTGDLVFYDEDGFFWYVGRKDDQIKIYGKWVAPQAIEEALLEFPPIKEVIVGLEDLETENEIQKLVAYVVLKPGFESNSQQVNEILAFSRQKLQPYQTPKHIVFFNQLPRTVNGKIVRRKIHSQATTKL